MIVTWLTLDDMHADTKSITMAWSMADCMCHKVCHEIRSVADSNVVYVLLV